MAMTQVFNQAVIVTDFQISLEVDHVLEGQGIPPSRASGPLLAAAQDVIDEAQGLVAPAALYTIIPVRHFEHREIVLENGATFSGSLMARALAGASEVALAVCTIGPALEERMAALFAEGDAVRALEPIGPAADKMAGFADFVFENTWRLTNQP